MYDSLSNEISVMTSVGLSREVHYIEQEIENQDPEKAGSNIANLSMEIQKGKYDGSNEAFVRMLLKHDEER